MPVPASTPPPPNFATTAAELQVDSDSSTETCSSHSSNGCVPSSENHPTPGRTLPQTLTVAQLSPVHTILNSTTPTPQGVHGSCTDSRPSSMHIRSMSQHDFEARPPAALSEADQADMAPLSPPAPPPSPRQSPSYHNSDNSMPHQSRSLAPLDVTMADVESTSGRVSERQDLLSPL